MLVPRGATLRQNLRDALREGPSRTARDLSKLVGIPERDVAEHLEHLERSVRHEGLRLVIEPAECLDCGFRFDARRQHRFTRPGRCPDCHSGRLTLPRFTLEGEER